MRVYPEAQLLGKKNINSQFATSDRPEVVWWIKLLSLQMGYELESLIPPDTFV